MGWSIGSGIDDRDIGYGVPALCDHPKCAKKINRGLSYCCGGYLSGYGCGLYFCSDHLVCVRKPHGCDDDIELCSRCKRYKPPYEPKEDIQEWIDHKLNDPSWAKWRQDNPEFVKKYIKYG